MYSFLALQDFSRFVVATMLIPVLQQSGRGVVLDVLAAGVWNEFDLEDLELRKKSPNFFSEFNYLQHNHRADTLFLRRCFTRRGLTRLFNT